MGHGCCGRAPAKAAVSTERRRRFDATTSISKGHAVSHFDTRTRHRRRARHLIDPDNPPPPSRYSTELSTVQTWVLSTLAVTTILHMSAGLVVAAAFADAMDARIGLLVIAGLFGIVSVAAGLAIHKRRILSWWLLLGWLPSIVGAWIVFR
jgi:hypothetical protein